MNTRRRFLIVGGGSMGKRRIRCLQAHDVPTSDISLIDRRADRRAESKARYDVESFDDFTAGWAWNPDVLIVSTPTKYHMQYCLEAARAGKDFFCEIALSDNLDGADELLALVNKRQLVAALGINNPCHAVWQRAKAWLQEEAFGAPVTWQMSFGNYLPNWHPWENYQDFYDETQIMGVISQELATLYTLLDTRISEIFAQTHNSGALEIDGPDNVQILARTSAGAAVTLQLDLLQDFQKYEYRVVSEKGVIEVNLLPPASAKRYLNSTQQFELMHPPAGYTFEQAYIDEFGLFLDALESREGWYHSLGDGIHILRCLDAVKRSSRSGQRVAIND